MTKALSIAWVVVLSAAASGASAQTLPGNQCVTCHFANFLTVPAPAHLDEWAQSAHARQAIGCERCHDGDPKSTVAAEAHLGVRGSRDPSSPVNWRNVTSICGMCHIGPLNAFQTSAHFRLRQLGDAFTPDCTTCHGAMTATRPRTGELERQCAQCHPPVSGESNRAIAARRALEEIQTVRVLLSRADMLIANLDDSPRRRRLSGQSRGAASSLAAGVFGLHSFNLRLAGDRLATARREADRLLREIAQRP